MGPSLRAFGLAEQARRGPLERVLEARAKLVNLTMFHVEHCGDHRAGGRETDGRQRERVRGLDRR
jgi:hypothetical protein